MTVSDRVRTSSLLFSSPLYSLPQSSIYTLCTNVCYQEEFEQLLVEHAEILADRSVVVFFLD